MLPRVDTSVRPLASVEAPNAAAQVGETRQDVVSRLSQLVVGKQIQGDIISRLNDGTFVVRLNGATARMALPGDSKPGTSVPLTLITTNPRPTFLLDSGDGAGTTVALTRQEVPEAALHASDSDNAANPLPGAKQNAVGGYLLETAQGRTEAVKSNQLVESKAEAGQNSTDGHGTSTPTSLSTAGKLIDQILHAAQQQNVPNSLVGKTPLAATAEAMAQPDKMADTLKQTISSSGLFYESHIADWAEGKRPLSDLMREPQAQIGKSSGNDADLSSAGLTKNTEMTQIVNQQLNTLEQQRIVWQGNLLPGQRMEWEVSRNYSGKKTEQAEAEQSWQSTVRFELPHLGAIAATINLHGEHVQIFVRTDSDSSAAALQEHAVTLAEALKQAGAQLDSFSVKKDEQT
ncbi:flagellar hook-length control protein FliK [Undibacterium sp. TJN25]|uniref:flagellar hook-length control protein FliK n=1 Tax=Undibacterium sp. TJN25 TaxID=3413056 RepID=UPI003BF2BFD5